MRWRRSSVAAERHLYVRPGQRTLSEAERDGAGHVHDGRGLTVAEAAVDVPEIVPAELLIANPGGSAGDIE